MGDVDLYRHGARVYWRPRESIPPLGQARTWRSAR
jgi:hypothetical protein